MLQVRFRQRNAWRNTIDDAAERQPVRFAEGGYAKELSNCVQPSRLRYCCVCVFT
ncbi:hypothetical protein ACLBOM_13700 [Escherichia coli]